MLVVKLLLGNYSRVKGCADIPPSLYQIHRILGQKSRLHIRAQWVYLMGLLSHCQNKGEQNEKGIGFQVSGLKYRVSHAYLAGIDFTCIFNICEPGFRLRHEVQVQKGASAKISVRYRNY